MRTITQALLALGFVGAMAIGTPITTNAQGIQISPSGSVEIGDRQNRNRQDQRNRNDEPNASGYRSPNRDRYQTSNGCPENYTVQDGLCKPYRSR